MSSGGGSFVSPPAAVHLDTNAVENIRVFGRQWKHYARITGIDQLSEEVKISVLFSLMGETARSLADSLFEQNVAGNRNVDSILSALENHFLSYDDLTYERYIFDRMTQNVDESADDFANRVRYQGTRCDFRDQVNDFVRDRFILGLANENLKNFLLKNTLTFEVALDLSRMVEQNDDSRTIAGTITARTDDSALPVSESSSLSQPSCPTEDLLLGTENDSSSLDLYHAPRFASQTCPTLYRDVVSSRMAAKPHAAESSVGTYVALKHHLKHVKGNPPIWRVYRAGFLEKFSPCVQSGVKMYRSSRFYIGWNELTYDKYEKVEIETETKERDSTGRMIRMVLPKARVKFNVGSYIVLRSDLRAKDRPPIWRVCSASLLHKFVPYRVEGEIRTYMRSNVYLEYTDWKWRLTKEDYYEVAVVRETMKDEFVVAEKGKRGGVNTSKNPKSNLSTLQKTRIDKINNQKKNRKRKIKDRMAIGLVNLMCCCA